MHMRPRHEVARSRNNNMSNLERSLIRLKSREGDQLKTYIVLVTRQYIAELVISNQINKKK